MGCITLQRRCGYIRLRTKWLLVHIPLLSLKLKPCSKTLREKCPYSELFWSVLSCIWTEFGKIHRITPHTGTFQALKVPNEVFVFFITSVLRTKRRILYCTRHRVTYIFLQCLFCYLQKHDDQIIADPFYINEIQTSKWSQSVARSLVIRLLSY